MGVGVGSQAVEREEQAGVVPQRQEGQVEVEVEVLRLSERQAAREEVEEEALQARPLELLRHPLRLRRALVRAAPRSSSASSERAARQAKDPSLRRQYSLLPPRLCRELWSPRSREQSFCRGFPD